jgi:site-specific DNA-methyltransferase (cytosine-N4-specific)
MDTTETTPDVRLYWHDETAELLLGDTLDVLRTLPDGAVDCIVTSPPYWNVRDYGYEGQYGLEDSPLAYVATMRAVFAEARRVLAADGTLWLNLGDTYAMRADAAASRSFRADAAEVLPARVNATAVAPRKSLLMVPERVALALSEDGWILRNKIVWHKPNAMPQSATDRLSGRYEHVFLLTKSPRYFFDLDAIREPQKTAGRRHEGRSCGSGEGWPTGWSTKRRALNPKGGNPGDVWALSARPYPAAHFATFPIDLPVRCITAGCKPGGVVLDPFSGSGTTGAAARLLGRRYIGIDKNPDYHDLATDRFAQAVLDACNETPADGAAECNETPCQAPRCGQPVRQPATGRRRRFCSDACRVRAHRAAKDADGA